MLSVTAAPRFRAAAAFNFPRPVAELSQADAMGIVRWLGAEIGAAGYPSEGIELGT
jgi:hypothetical protein